MDKPRAIEMYVREVRSVINRRMAEGRSAEAIAREILPLLREIELWMLLS